MTSRQKTVQSDIGSYHHPRLDSDDPTAQLLVATLGTGAGALIGANMAGGLAGTQDTNWLLQKATSGDKYKPTWTQSLTGDPFWKKRMRWQAKGGLLGGALGLGGVGALMLSKDSSGRAREETRVNEKSSQMLPEMNPTLALAKSLMTDAGAIDKVKTIHELNELEQHQRRTDAYRKMEREKTIDAVHEAKQRLQAAALQEAMQRWSDQAGAEQLGQHLDRSVRDESPVEGDLMSAMGLSMPDEDQDSHAADPDVEDAPMNKASAIDCISMELRGLCRHLSKESQDMPSEAELRNAGLVGYQMGPDDPFLETYLEETAPTAKSRLMRGALVGGVSGLGGGVAGLAAQKAMPALMGSAKNPALRRFALKMRNAGSKPGVIGAAIGTLAGGLAGGLSNRSIYTGYNTGTGEEIGMFDRREAQNIFDTLSPGAQPGNFSVAAAGDMPSLGDSSPQVAYGVDLDEAIAEDPTLARDLLKRASYGPNLDELRRDRRRILRKHSEGPEAGILYGALGAGGGHALGRLLAPGLEEAAFSAMDKAGFLKSLKFGLKNPRVARTLDSLIMDRKLAPVLAATGGLAGAAYGLTKDSSAFAAPVHDYKSTDYRDVLRDRKRIMRKQSAAYSTGLRALNLPKQSSRRREEAAAQGAALVAALGGGTAAGLLNSPRIEDPEDFLEAVVPSALGSGALTYLWNRPWGRR